MIVDAKLNRNPTKNCRCDSCARWLYFKQGDWHIKVSYDAPEVERLCVQCAYAKQRRVYNQFLAFCLESVEIFMSGNPYAIRERRSAVAPQRIVKSLQPGAPPVRLDHPRCAG